MKKLTNRVKAFDLYFDVHPDVTHITADSDGMIKAHYAPPDPLGSIWFSKTKGLFNQADWIYKVDLEGADWRECCWYVGDQVDGEVAERREWMARGAETVVSRLENGVVGADKHEGVCASIKIGRVTIRDIRSGEVDL